MNEIEIAIKNKNKQDFYIATIEKKLLLTHHHFDLLDEANLLFDWIDECHYKQIGFLIQDDIFDFLFKYDDIENFKLHFDQNNTYHLYPLLFHNAKKCLKYYLAPGNRLVGSFTNSALIYAITHKCDLSIIKLLIKSNLVNINEIKYYKKYKTCLDYAIKYQGVNMLVYLIQHGGKFWNASNSIQTQLEKQFLIRLTKTCNWLETSDQLSINHKRLRESKKKHFRTKTDQYLHEKTQLFIWDKFPRQKYSTLFKELWFFLVYSKIMEIDWNFIPPIKSIVYEYLNKVDKDVFFLF